MISPGLDRPSVSNLERFREMIQPGVIGNFTHCEITEIFANVEGASGPQNVFTLAVLEERDISAPSRLLNPKRLSLQSLRGWSFGICRTFMNLSEFEHSLTQFDTTGIWSPSGNVLTTGALRQTDPQFVPPDWTDSIPLNKVLKNNFWAGSHVLEWADLEKGLFKPFFEKASLLQELVEILASFVPVELATVSDRLGNLLVQVPITMLVASCEPARDNSGHQLRVEWRPGQAQRPLRAFMMAEYDGTVTGFTTTLVDNEPVKLHLPADAGEPKVFLFDEEHNVLVSGTAPLSWFSQIGVTAFFVSRAEPRTFSYLDHVGQMQAQRIART